MSNDLEYIEDQGPRPPSSSSKDGHICACCLHCIDLHDAPCDRVQTAGSVDGSMDKG